MAGVMNMQVKTGAQRQARASVRVHAIAEPAKVNQVYKRQVSFFHAKSMP